MSGKGKRRRREKDATEIYSDDEGNRLELRRGLSPATIASLDAAPARAADSAEDAWQRREEMLFERLAVSWEIAGLPITEQQMLLGRYRMASSEERDWVRATIDEHLRRFIPEAL